MAGTEVHFLKADGILRPIPPELSALGPFALGIWFSRGDVFDRCESTALGRCDSRMLLRILQRMNSARKAANNHRPRPQGVDTAPSAERDQNCVVLRRVEPSGNRQ